MKFPNNKITSNLNEDELPQIRNEKRKAIYSYVYGIEKIKIKQPLRDH